MSWHHSGLATDTKCTKWRKSHFLTPNNNNNNWFHFRFPQRWSFVVIVNVDVSIWIEIVRCCCCSAEQSLKHFTRLLIWKLFISLARIRMESSIPLSRCYQLPSKLFTHTLTHSCRRFIRRKTLSVVFNNLIDLFSLSFSSTFHISLSEFEC